MNKKLPPHLQKIVDEQKEKDNRYVVEEIDPFSGVEQLDNNPV